jgi:Uma2 family endonuclease
MSLLSAPAPAGQIVYPESDGLPMSDNTKQFRWIVMLYGNLAGQFRDRDDVFVSGNQNWYPVEGHPEIVTAPDVYVVFGRPKGDRPSWKQWEEAGVPMTVVFEVLSPSNTVPEMADKLAFYDEHGAEEYYIYDPDTNRLLVYVRQGVVLRRVWEAHGHVSPRLGIRFDLSGPEMVVYRPDGSRFLTFEELKAAQELAEFQRDQAVQRADHAQQRADQAERRAARLAELGRKARKGQATPEELQELERLEEQAGPPSP